MATAATSAAVQTTSTETTTVEPSAAESATMEPTAAGGASMEAASVHGASAVAKAAASDPEPWSIVHAVAIVGRKSIVRTRAPSTVIGAELMKEVATAEVEGSGIRETWRIKSPAKRAEQNAIPRDERERVKPGIPIPAVHKPVISWVG